MKIKYLIIILAVSLVLLLYFLFCYKFVNNNIYKETESIIDKYFNEKCNNCIFDFEYLKSTLNTDNSINIYIKVDSKFLEKYYHFTFINNTNSYKIINVDNEIPSYIK